MGLAGLGAELDWDLVCPNISLVCMVTPHLWPGFATVLVRFLDPSEPPFPYLRMGEGYVMEVACVYQFPGSNPRPWGAF